ncbi:hypothetical protein LU699_06880 [Luteimonas fraxinea]|uniref:Antitoxin Xre/MbcA/ParS-like toxin-binding domain-containing protein n=1 Tax=Luteimonas fraxinea TaxID=2901869 RepID=A0ABS8U6F6_9GAMM|nr:hypothetical protein [Luteimonas fraxinea]MCD9095367.1 hypothetical protein [Luteimonas fraxinea]UHH11419.1 hypothetical protein LU699_06880 [Luteimonas fraxinea]
MTPPVAERRVLELAVSVVNDPMQVEAWYSSDPIAVLGGRTAQTAVAAGDGNEVVSFLLNVLCLERAG